MSEATAAASMTIERLDAWMDTAVELYDSLFERSGCFRVRREQPPGGFPEEFPRLADEIAAWADGGGCNVDPVPLLDLLALFMRCHGKRRSVAVYENLPVPSDRELGLALEAAGQAWRRMRNTIRFRETGKVAILVAKGELRKAFDVGETKFRELLDEWVSSGKVRESSRNARTVDVMDETLITRLRGNPA